MSQSIYLEESLYSKGCLGKEEEVSAYYSGLNINFYRTNKMGQQYSSQIMALIWQKIAFYKRLQTFLSHIHGSTLNHIEFQLLLHQANIVFAHPSHSHRCQQRFSHQPEIQKIEILKNLRLVKVVVVHAQEQYLVVLRKNQAELSHENRRCFQFWRQRMREKFSNLHEWFQQLNQEKDIRRVSVHRFISQIDKTLKGSAHEKCGKHISLSFEKTRKNEIQSTVFINTIILSQKTHPNTINNKTHRSHNSTRYLSKSENFKRQGEGWVNGSSLSIKKSSKLDRVDCWVIKKSSKQERLDGCAVRWNGMGQADPKRWKGLGLRD